MLGTAAWEFILLGTPALFITLLFIEDRLTRLKYYLGMGHLLSTSPFKMKKEILVALQCMNSHKVFCLYNSSGSVWKRRFHLERCSLPPPFYRWILIKIDSKMRSGGKKHTHTHRIGYKKKLFNARSLNMGYTVQLTNHVINYCYMRQHL